MEHNFGVEEIIKKGRDLKDKQNFTSWSGLWPTNGQVVHHLNIDENLLRDPRMIASGFREFKTITDVVQLPSCKTVPRSRSEVLDEDSVLRV